MGFKPSNFSFYSYFFPPALCLLCKFKLREKYRESIFCKWQINPGFWDSLRDERLLICTERIRYYHLPSRWCNYATVLWGYSHGNLELLFKEMVAFLGLQSTIITSKKLTSH